MSLLRKSKRTTDTAPTAASPPRAGEIGEGAAAKFNRGSKTSSVLQEGETDELLRCLQFVAERFGISKDPAVLLAGLALPGTPISIDVFSRCAERAGLELQSISARASELTSADLPALAWQVSGRPVVIVAAERRESFSTFDPATGELSSRGVAELDTALQRDIVSIAKPIEAPGADDPERPEADQRWISYIFRQFWRSHFYIVAASLWINVLALAVPLFAMNVYDRVLPNKALPTLWVLGIAVLAGAALELALRSARSTLIDHVGRRMDLRTSSRIMERVLNAKYDAKLYSTGEMSQKLSQFELLREFLTSSTLSTFIDLVFSIVFLVVVYFISPYFIIYPLFCLVVMAIIGIAIQLRIGRAVRQVDATVGARHALMAEIIAGIEPIKSVRGESKMLQKWDAISAESSNASEVLKKQTAFAANFSQFAQQTVSIATVMVGAYLFDAGAVSVGGIIAASMLAGRAVTPFGQLALMLARSRQAWSAFRSVDRLMRLPDERLDKQILMSRKIRQCAIEFAGVSFAYGDSARFVLKDFTLKVAPGERIGIVGRVGAGKTTIGRLLARYIDPSAGEIRIDGVDIRHYHPHEVRRAIRFVGQDAEIFRGTIRSNLLLAKPDATDEELIAAASLAGVDEFANRHSKGYESEVGERGNLLSSGQRQMIGLARNFLDPGLVLFLDDPTSSMDMQNERVFLQRLKGVLTNARQTLIVTTHRNAVLTIVDRLIVLDGGRVVADGPPAEVIGKLRGRGD